MVFQEGCFRPRFMHNATLISTAREFIMSLQLYLAFVAACFALALLPGPIVTLLIANACATAPARRWSISPARKWALRS
jgi:hypothetical protein